MRTSKIRTQNREAVSHAQARIRDAVNRNPTEPLTALLHHLTLDVLQAGFFSLKKGAAPGVDGVLWEYYAGDLEKNLESVTNASILCASC
jgi:RNA-directed DNA polymerase